MINAYIQKYGKRLYGFCLALCADPHDADDLYQDTWVKAIKNISQYDTSREFEPWITKICINTYRNTLRRMAKSPVHNNFKSDDEKDAILENVAAQPFDDYSYLHHAINKLPEKLRITLILFYFRDMDILSAAKLLGIPQGTVKSRLSKARKMLYLKTG